VRREFLQHLSAALHGTCLLGSYRRDALHEGSADTVFWDVRREFTQRVSVVLHGTLGSYLRDGLQEGGATAVTPLPAPRASASLLPYFPLL